MPIHTPQTEGEAPSRYTCDAWICTTCRDLLIRPNEAVKAKKTAMYMLDTISVSASRGCSICQALERAHSPKDRIATVSKMEVEVWFYGTRAVMIQKRTDPSSSCDIVLRLLPAHSYGTIGQGSVEFLNVPAQTIPVSTPVLAKNTGDNSCIAQVATWMNNCITMHKDCNATPTSATSAIRPARVLEIGENTVTLKTSSNIIKDSTFTYMTVSHRWSTIRMPKLLTANLASMQQGLQTGSLPAVFQDAISLARAMCIRFLWIDALCIVQDSALELQTEISNMGHIYRNAILNVGALGTSKYRRDHTESVPRLFVDRNPDLLSPFALTIQREGFRQRYFAYDWYMSLTVDRNSLMERAWVLQERLLSRRSVYFSTDIWWECSEQRASETFPGQHPDHLCNDSRRITALLRSPSIGDHLKQSGIEAEANTRRLHGKWRYLINTYTECKLTFEDDYLVALSGIAQEFRTALDEDYYAGVWSGDIVNGLLWFRDTSHYDDEGVRPEKYRAPSWSWASVNLEVSYILKGFVSEPVIIAAVLHTEVIPEGPDSTGKIKGGYIRISGHLRESKRSCSKKYIKHFKTWTLDRLDLQYEQFDEGYLSDGDRPMDQCFFFLMAYQTERVRKKVDYNTLSNGEARGNQEVNGDELKIDLGRVYGLILEAVDLDNAVYRRIGAFKHMWGDGRTFEDNPKPEDYPEFVDFDPENFERHTITII